MKYSLNVFIFSHEVAKEILDTIVTAMLTKKLVVASVDKVDQFAQKCRWIKLVPIRVSLFLKVQRSLMQRSQKLQLWDPSQMKLGHEVNE